MKMREQRRYNLGMLVGIIVLLTGLVRHSWLAFAVGALLAGAGGLFGMLASGGRNGGEVKDKQGRDE